MKKFILLFVPFILYAWTAPVNISNTESRSKYPALAQDSRGWLHVVYEDVASGDDDIYYQCYNGTTWTDTLNISHDSTTSWRPDVAVDTLNRVHVVWGDYYTGEIMWTVKDGNSWSTPVPISNTAPFSVAPEVALSPVTNYVHCVWHNLGDAEIWHAYYDGGSWSVPENVTQDSNDDAWADVAVDDLDRVHLVWMDYDSIDIYYSRKDSTSWSSPVEISNLSGWSCDPRIAVDNNNNPRVVWEERSGGSYGYYTYFNGSEWINAILVDTDYSSKIEISVAEDNKSYLVWRHGSGVDDIYFTVYKDTIPEFPPENASNSDSISLGARVVVDTEYVHLVWGEAYGTAPDDNIEIYYSKKEKSGVINEGEIETSFFIPYITRGNLSLSYNLKHSSNISITFYDIIGRKLREKQLGYKEEGIHQDSIFLDLPSGIYFSVLKAGIHKYREKFILINP